MTRSTWRRTLDLAGMRIAVEASGGDVERFETRFGGFASRSNDREPAIRLQLEIDERHGAIPQPAGVIYPACIGHLGDRGVIDYQRNGLRMAFDPTRQTAEAVAVPSLGTLDASEDPTPLDTPLRLLLSYSLPARDGFLVHSSGYGDERGAVLFAGVSGSGKTTTARKLEHPNVLSDDQVAVRRLDGRWMAFALPFVGEYRRTPFPRVSPLKRILLLRQGASGTRIAPLHPAVAATRLLACVPWFVPGAEVMPALLSLASEVARSGALAELTIGRDEPVRELIEGLLRCNSD